MAFKGRKSGGILNTPGVAWKGFRDSTCADSQLPNEAPAASLTHPVLGPRLSAEVGDTLHWAHPLSLRINF